ncbi:MAG TPA: hypothetical protein DCK76_11915 [Desulfotomaculum sp.]|nr:MAG: hypothetical protein XD78_1686 [Desulfotomaculum sp. 46_296]HAG12044.1 hypothetical protein [Desulfotomaculum sp.]HBY03304.1 hypothetical protein [Desulfotomaculum sp.]
MFSPEELKRLINRIQRQLGDFSSPVASGDGDSCVKKECLLFPISPQKMLVIFGLLTGALEVDAVFLDRDRTVQIILEGSLITMDTSEKTNMDKKLDELGSMPFDQVIKTLLEKL